MYPRFRNDYFFQNKTYIALDQDTSRDNSIDGSTQCQKSSGERKFVGSRDARFEDVFFLNIAFLEGFLATINQVCHVLIVPSRADDSDSNVTSIQIAERNLAFSSLSSDGWIWSRQRILQSE